MIQSGSRYQNRDRARLNRCEPPKPDISDEPVLHAALDYELEAIAPLASGLLAQTDQEKHSKTLQRLCFQ